MLLTQHAARNLFAGGVQLKTVILFDKTKKLKIYQIQKELVNHWKIQMKKIDLNVEPIYHSYNRALRERLNLMKINAESCKLEDFDLIKFKRYC